MSLPHPSFDWVFHAGDMIQSIVGLVILAMLRSLFRMGTRFFTRFEKHERVLDTHSNALIDLGVRLPKDVFFDPVWPGVYRPAERGPKEEPGK